MIDLTLTAPDRASMIAALTAAGLWDNVNNAPITASHDHALNFPDVQYAPDGTTTTDKQGNVTRNMAQVKGSWAYLRVVDTSPLPKVLASGIVDKPATTLNEWSGGSYVDAKRYDPAQDKVVTLDAATVKAKVTALQTVTNKAVAADVVNVDVAAISPVADVIQ